MRRLDVYIPDDNTALLTYLDEMRQTTGISQAKMIVLLATQQVKGIVSSVPQGGTAVQGVGAVQGVDRPTDLLTPLFNDDIASSLMEEG